MDYSDERLVETQLEEQLQEQSESLDAINEALNSDPTNPELLEVRFVSLISYIRIIPSMIVFLISNTEIYGAYRFQLS